MKKFMLSVGIQGFAKGLFLPFWIIYLSNIGLSFLEIGILGTISEIVRFITEVPFGVLADKKGRKTVLVYSSILYFISLFMLSYFKTFNFIILSIILLGLAESFESGALSAWLVDYLILYKQEDHIESQVTNMYIIMIIGSIGGALSIATLYNASNNLPFVVSSVLFIISFLILKLFVIETLPRTEDHEEKLSSKQILKKSIIMINKDKFLRIFAIAVFFYSFGLDGIERFYQNFLDSKSFTIGAISGVFIVSSILSLVIMKYQSKLTKYFKNPLPLISIAKIIMGGLVILAINSNEYISYIIIIAFFTVDISLKPMIQIYLNSRIDSSIRATLLSFFELVGSAGETVSGIAIGYLMKAYGFSMGFGASSLLIVVSGLLVMVIVVKDFMSRKNYGYAIDDSKN